MPAQAALAPAFAKVPPECPEPAQREVRPALGRGLRGRCPACGEGKMFRSYLKVSDTCPSCGEELHHQRADDAPPYMTIFVAGHIVGALMIFADETWPEAPLWLHAMIWPALTLILSLWLLPIVKGALVGYQWALRMHGFEHAGAPQRAARQSSGT